ncbi:MAG: VacJ family lipoprotein [Gammaproteobacteria bacterium]|nr:VacJ family lipoprotein [Gammaproteobacteria bacterium]MCP4091157.1 VacJ family lipoprotein [Gammaproteobacteria bacterium]MCP4277317.1 VacJ family lipoprotein [Gammaproteobacteria bacterium]MCP4831622.1 VacJ family lipoprotein [Gammaproteobacteria bacterium]MCP4927845.1 VacJ family lipoprotein [Gammaproteobacteria bacterium]
MSVGRSNQRWRLFTYLPLFLLLVSALLLNTGCASRKASKAEPNADPLEVINRPIYKFNDVTDRYILRPVAKGYQFITPNFVETGISNFFDNITYTVTIVNDFLQGKFKQGFADTGRFALNTTLGLLGLFDVATPMGLEYHDEDFGQTFAKWGIPAGPYIVVPLFGPRTVRSGIGTLADWRVNLLNYYSNTSVRDKLLILWAIESRAALVGPDELIFDAFDPYLFVRDAYLQNRAFLINDGIIGETDEGFDDSFDDDF